MLNPKRLAAALLLGSAMVGAHASAVTKTGTEYRILPSLPGDQSVTQLAFGADGGYLVTQDNSIDGNGLGIRARRFYGDLTAAQNTFQVNAVGLSDQQNARVALLKGGGAVFAWESSTGSGHRIYLRFLNADDVFVGGDVPASRYVAGSQSDASLTVLADGTVCVVWAEWNRDGSMDGIFGQLLTPAGVHVGNTFQVNQKSSLSQRTPSVAALEDGKFVVSWITDENRSPESIDIYARLFNGDATAAGAEFPVNTWKYQSVNGVQTEIREVCANPTLLAVPGGFRAAWSNRPYTTSVSDWDVKTRTFDLQGQATSDAIVVNNTTQGDQFSPRLALAGNSQLVVWTSFGQDGSDEGIFARALKSSGEFDGDEFQVNTRTINKQIFPAVTGVGSSGFVVAWSSFVGGTASYDLFAQNYTLTPVFDLPAPAAPFVSALSQNSILATWSDVTSEPGSTYSLYVDDDATPLTTTAGLLTVTRDSWAPASAHTFRLSYTTPAGKTSGVSTPATATTWGADLNGNGLPDDWEQIYFGKLKFDPNADTDGDGATNLEEFLAGTDPTDPTSVLRTRISGREQGLYIEWNTLAGNYYQLQVTSDFSSWSNIGTPRFAHSDVDSLPCTGPGQVRYYRVIRMR